MTVNVRRAGFTLIELLVVIFIIGTIATLVVMAVPSMDKNKGVPNATNEIAGWIRMSRQTAIRDQNPTGVRFIVDPTDGMCRSMQYITQPPPLAPRGDNVRLKLFSQAPSMASPVVTYADLVRQNGMNPDVPLPWENVYPGDFLELSDSPRVVARITAVSAHRLTLDRQVEGLEVSPVPGAPPPYALELATGFRVHRAPQPLVGEPILTFNSDVFINPTTSQMSGADLLFNGNGAVANAPQSLYVLVVQHQDKPTLGRLLIGITTRTGKVSTAPYNDAGPDAFSFLRDGRAPGL